MDRGAWWATVHGVAIRISVVVCRFSNETCFIIVRRHDQTLLSSERRSNFLVFTVSRPTVRGCLECPKLKIPWTEEPGRLQSVGSLESDRTERLPFHFSLSCIGEGNGNPLQCSCLENPRDGEAWWAAINGVT